MRTDQESLQSAELSIVGAENAGVVAFMSHHQSWGTLFDETDAQVIHALIIINTLPTFLQVTPDIFIGWPK